MKRLLSIRYTETGFNLSILVLRISFGLLMIVQHGFPKLMKFAQLYPTFYDPLGIGGKWSLVLVIFAEIFCSLFLIMGLFTRIALLPLCITMLFAIFGANKGNFAGAELAILYGTAFFTLLLCGPGRISVDGMMKK
jgi:putative oxidoreductase